MQHQEEMPADLLPRLSRPADVARSLSRLIDVTQQRNAPLILTLIQSLKITTEQLPPRYMPRNTAIVLSNEKRFLTHPVQQWIKHGKPHIYLKVLSLDCLGYPGSYGGVYPVLGEWRLKEEVLRYKIKTTAVKIIEYGPEFSAQQIASRKEMCRKEAQMAKLFPYMGVHNSSLLLTEHRGFIEMNIIEGESLRAIIDRLRIDPSYKSGVERIRIGLNLFRAIQSIQTGLMYPDNPVGREIMHGDIKPSNVICGSNVVLTDFGLAHLQNYPLFKRAGTPVYMAPEYLKNKVAYNTAKENNTPLPAAMNLSPVQEVFSTALIIIELMGCSERAVVEQVNGKANYTKIMELNKNVLLDRIFFNTPDLSPVLIQALREMIYKATREDPEERPTNRELMSAFFSADQSGHSFARQRLKRLIGTPLAALEASEMMELLRSDYLDLWLLPFNKEDVAFIVRVLDYKLLFLDIHILEGLHRQGMSLHDSCLLDRYIKEFLNNERPLNINLVKYLLDSNAPVSEEVLSQLLTYDFCSFNDPGSRPKIDDLRIGSFWINLCYLMYAHVPNFLEFVDSAWDTIHSPFKKVFCKYFLLNQQGLSAEVIFHLLWNHVYFEQMLLEKKQAIFEPFIQRAQAYAQFPLIVRVCADLNKFLSYSLLLKQQCTETWERRVLNVQMLLNIHDQLYAITNKHTDVDPSEAALNETIAHILQPALILLGQSLKCNNPQWSTVLKERLSSMQSFMNSVNTLSELDVYYNEVLLLIEKHPFKRNDYIFICQMAYQKLDVAMLAKWVQMKKNFDKCNALIMNIYHLFPAENPHYKDECFQQLRQLANDYHTHLTDEIAEYAFNTLTRFQHIASQLAQLEVLTQSKDCKISNLNTFKLELQLQKSRHCGWDERQQFLKSHKVQKILQQESASVPLSTERGFFRRLSMRLHLNSQDDIPAAAATPPSPKS